MKIPYVSCILISEDINSIKTAGESVARDTNMGRHKVLETQRGMG